MYDVEKMREEDVDDLADINNNDHEEEIKIHIQSVDLRGKGRVYREKRRNIDSDKENNCDS